jgi:hypothetical protein
MVKPTTGGYILVDMDGTLAVYEGWTPWNVFGAPIPAMVQRIKGWLAEGKDVRIFTARMPLDETAPQKCRHTGEEWTGVQMKWHIANYTELHVGQRLRAQCWKDLNCVEIWDDRAIGVVANTGETLVEAALAEANALKGRAYGDGKGRFA